MNMLDVWEGAPPLRQAFTLTMNSSLSLRRPCLISLKVNSAVISLERLAGATSSSAAFSKSTLPLSASIRMAWGAAVWKPPSGGLGLVALGAATAATAAPAIAPAQAHRRRARQGKPDIIG